MNTRLGHRSLSAAIVEQVLWIELAQPVRSERWPGAMAQQPLADYVVRLT